MCFHFHSKKGSVIRKVAETLWEGGGLESNTPMFKQDRKKTEKEIALIYGKCGACNNKPIEMFWIFRMEFFVRFKLFRD